MSEAWHKNSTDLALPKNLVGDRLGLQSYSDNKIELMGQTSRVGMFLQKKFKRFC
jgi:hypothetical protein